MTIQARPPHGRDDDGVRIVKLERGRRVYWMMGMMIALPIVATVIAVVYIRSAPQATSAPPAVAVPEVIAQAEVPPPAPRPAASRSPGAHVAPRRIVTAPVTDPAGLGASPVPQPQKPRREIDAADVIVALREEGVHDGIAAFGIPGTQPPKSGILVPEEFELPEGYVRHYQSTDDGEQLPAILMFHPDYEFVNEQGGVVKLPDDMVVRPDMAPPGLDAGHVLDVPPRKGGEPIR